MGLVDAHLQFVTLHLYAIVFVAFLLEGTGLPLPSRILLILAGTLVSDARQLIAVAAACFVGAVLGDHLPFLGGRLAGTRVLAVYCRLTLGSRDCVEKTVKYFVRFGPAAILLSRFSASIRIFAAALSGCGHVTYPRFLAYDMIGSAAYGVLWVWIGYAVGGAALDLVQRSRALKVLVLVGPVALVALLGYRLWRRAKHGAVTAADIRAIPPVCPPDSPVRG